MLKYHSFMIDTLSSRGDLIELSDLITFLTDLYRIPKRTDRMRYAKSKLQALTLSPKTIKTGIYDAYKWCDSNIQSVNVIDVHVQKANQHMNQITYQINNQSPITKYGRHLQVDYTNTPHDTILLKNSNMDINTWSVIIDAALYYMLYHTERMYLKTLQPTQIIRLLEQTSTSKMSIDATFYQHEALYHESMIYSRIPFTNKTHKQLTPSNSNECSYCNQEGNDMRVHKRYNQYRFCESCQTLLDYDM